MKHSLVEEQEKICDYLRLIKEEKKVYRRKNFILLGKLGSGKSRLLQELGRESGFKYINFTKECLNDFYRSGYLSFRYLDSNDFLTYISNKFVLSSDFYLIDALEGIVTSIYQSGGKGRLITFFKNFFIQKPKGYLLLAIPDLEFIDFNEIMRESDFKKRNIFYLDGGTLKNKLADIYQLPNVKVDEFKNNHYFKVYKGGSSL